MSETKTVETTEIVPINGNSLPVLPDPEAQVKFGQKAAKALMSVVEAKPNKLILGGKTYVDVADWEMIGHFFKTSAKTEWTKPIQGVAGIIEGYEARVVLINQITGIEIGGGEALCSRSEDNWKDKPDFQLKSMAQTRATGKALRNAFAWVVVLAGYEATPSEEMRDMAKKEFLICPSCKKKSVMAGKKEYGGGYVCWKKSNVGGCGAKFETLDDVTNPSGTSIAELVKNIFKGEKEFKKIGKMDEYKKVLDEFKIDIADNITDESTAKKVLLRLSTVLTLLKNDSK